jgi:hypothetical protein
MKTRNEEEMTVSTMQLDKQEKTLTLAIELRQGLVLAKLLDIMNSEQKTVQDWPVCQQSHSYQLALRDAKIVAMEKSISQLIHAVRGLQQRWWQPVLIINMPDIQQQIEPLGSYTMIHQEYDDKWGCTSTTNDES